mmetsp:Transcript_52828/g.78924  ORF Transcript_52828/g.78924 Transcript_52828/m.78924 type:complete len:210 (-) Transcript_52828:1749-2378(-)
MLIEPSLDVYPMVRLTFWLVDSMVIVVIREQLRLNASCSNSMVEFKSLRRRYSLITHSQRYKRWCLHFGNVFDWTHVVHYTQLLLVRRTELFRFDITTTHRFHVTPVWNIGCCDHGSNVCNGVPHSCNFEHIWILPYQVRSQKTTMAAPANTDTIGIDPTGFGQSHSSMNHIFHIQCTYVARKCFQRILSKSSGPTIVHVKDGITTVSA